MAEPLTGLVPGEVLTQRMDPLALEKLGHELSDYLDDMEREYNPLFKAIGTWWNWYEAKPRSEVKNHPFKNASNVVVPLIRMTTDALISQMFSGVFGADRTWITRTENTDRKEIAQNMARYINWASNGNDFNFQLNVYDWLSELYPIGSSVMAINYRRDIRPVFFGRGSNNRAKLRHQMVEFNRGVNFENIARENMLWDTRFEIGAAPFVSREHDYSWSQLAQIGQLDEWKSWSKEAVEKVKGQGSNFTATEADKVKAIKAALDDRNEPTAKQGRESHKVMELHVDWPILQSAGFQTLGDESVDAPHLPIVVHLHRNTRRVMRVVAEPYHLTHKPFFDGYFRKRVGRGHSIGVAKLLEHLQSAETTLFNQAIDAQTRANAIWAITSSRKHLDTPIDPAYPIYAPGMENEIKAFNILPAVQPNLSLMVAGQTIAERVSGQFDPALGRETRHGGHPSPATSTLALLEQAEKVAASTTGLIRERISKMGEAAAILYQQFETNDDGKINRVFGDKDAESITSYLFPQEAIPGNYDFDVLALSRSANPDTEMKRAVTIGQVNTNYWAFVIQGAQALESPQVGPAVKQMWQKAIQSQTAVYERFLEASNVDDMEKFLVQLREAGNDTQRAFGQFAGQARELAQGAAPVQAGGPPGGANGSVPGGAGTSPQGFGSLLQ